MSYLPSPPRISTLQTLEFRPTPSKILVSILMGLALPASKLTLANNTTKHNYLQQAPKGVFIGFNSKKTVQAVPSNAKLNHTLKRGLK